MKSVWLVLGIASVAWGQATAPSVVASPLDIDPTPALLKVDAALKKGFLSTLADKAGVSTPLVREMERFPEKLKRTDFRESNEALAQLATKAGTLYGVYAELMLTEGSAADRELVVSGRVVRDDGKVMATAKVQAKPGKDALTDTARVLFVRLFEQLGLKALPSFKEKPSEVVAPAPPMVMVLPAPTTAPAAKPEVVATQPLIEVPRTSLRGPGIGLLAGGGAVAIVGAVLTVIGSSSGVSVDERGNILVPAGMTREAAASAYGAAQWQQPTGGTLLGVGAAAAITGAFLVFVCDPAAERSRRAKVAVVPTRDGAMLSLGGTWP